MSGSTKAVLAVMLIVTVTLVAYIPAMQGGFVWDDDVLLYKNRTIQASDGLYRIWFTTEPYDYLPITWTSLWLEWRAWGDHPAGYHVTNVLLHAGSAVLVYFLLRRLAIPAALAAAMIFAVHPVNLASVAWISERKNTLAMVFYLLALLFYIRFDERRKPLVWYAVALLAFVLALLSKSAVVMAPVAMLGVAWWRRGKFAWRDVLAALPFFILSAVGSAVTVWFQNHRAIGESTVRGEGFFSRLATAGVAPWFYLSKILAPINLVMIYPRWEVDAKSILSYLPGACLVAALALFWAYRRSWGKAPLFAMGYFVVTLFPVLGFFDMSFAVHSLVADHFQYFAMIGPVAFLAGMGGYFARRLGRRRMLAAVTASIVITCVLGLLTWRQGKTYESLETMWQDVHRKNPRSSESWYNLGRLLAEKGKQQEAILYYRKALELRPAYSEAHNNLACDLANLADSQEKMGHLGLAAAYTDEALKHMAAAVESKPDNIEARYNLALALSRAGRSKEAIGHYRKAIETSEKFLLGEPTLAYNGLAELLATHPDPNVRNGPEALALAHLACAATGYGNPDMLKTLAAAYAETGRLDKALQTAQQALRISEQMGLSQMAMLIRQDMELYRAGKPLRENPPAPLGATAPAGN